MKILVGFDVSKVAETALKLAAEHAQAFGAQIFLVRSMVGGPDVPKRDFENNQRDEIELYLPVYSLHHS